MFAILRVGFWASICWLVCANALAQGPGITLSLHLLAQEQPKMTGNIRGVVVDSTGAVIAGSQVTLKAPAGGRNLTTTTNSQGEYRFAGLTAGGYVVEVLRKGFAVSQAQVSLKDGESKTLDFKLSVGPVEATVFVSGVPSYIVTSAVSATKGNEPLSELPVSVNVVPRAVLDDQHVIELGEAVHNVSGVTRASTDNAGEISNELAIRGFALNAANNYLLDGFRYDGEEHSETANLEDIEIIKGPESVLYGRMEPGGLVNLVSKKPLEKYYYSAQLTAGSFGWIRPQVDLSGPLDASGSLLYRLNLAYMDGGSYRQFVSGNRVFVAPVLTWRINPSTSITLSSQYLRDVQTADFGVVNLGTRPAPVPIATSYGEPYNNVYQEQRDFGYVLQHSFGSHWTLQNSYHAFLSNWSFLEVFQTDVDPVNLVVDREIGDSGFPRDWQYSETDLSGVLHTGKIEHRVLVGLELGYQANRDFGPFTAAFPSISLFNPVHVVTEAQALQFLAAGAGPDFVVLDTTRHNTIIAGYVQDQIALTRKLRLVLGVRLEQYRQHLFDPGDPDHSLSQFAPSPRGGILYQLAPGLSLYSSYSQSFNPVSSASLNFDGKPFQPTQGRQVEGGAKLETLHGNLSATAAVYYLQKQNVLTADPDHPGFSIQTGTQRSKGIDLDLSAHFSRSWNVIAAYGFCQPQITADNRFQVGNLLPNAAKHTASLWMNYEIPRGRLQGLGFGSGIWGLSQRQANLRNTFQLPGYARLDESVSYHFSRNERVDYKLSLGVKNLLNRTYYEEATAFGNYIWPGAPRSATGSLSVAWK